MKIRIKTLEQFAGVSLSTGRLGEPGDEVEVPDEEGATLCSEGIAEPIAEDADEGTETTERPDDAEKRAAAGPPAKRGPGRPRKSQE